MSRILFEGGSQRVSGYEWPVGPLRKGGKANANCDFDAE